MKSGNVEAKEVDFDEKDKLNEKALVDEIDLIIKELKRIYMFSTSSSKAHGSTGLFQSNEDKISKDTEKLSLYLSDTREKFHKLYYAVLEQKGLFDYDPIDASLDKLTTEAKKLYTLFSTPRSNEHKYAHLQQALYPIEAKALLSAEVLKTVTQAYYDAFKNQFKKYAPPESNNVNMNRSS